MSLKPAIKMRDIRINKRDEQQRRSSFNFTWDFPVHLTVTPFQPFIISGEPLLSANPSRTHLHRGQIFLCTASTRHRQARNITRSRGSSLTKPGSLTYLFFFFFSFFLSLLPRSDSCVVIATEAHSAFR